MVNAPGVAVFGRERRRLQREVGVGGPSAATGEGDAETGRPLLDGRGWVAGLGELAAGFALRGRGGVEEERGELQIEVVRLLEPFDLDEADVAPWSDEVGEDHQGNGFGLPVVRTHDPSICPFPADCPASSDEGTRYAADPYRPPSGTLPSSIQGGISPRWPGPREEDSSCSSS